ncbi:signal peptide containing large with proline stretches [Cryptosporidium sp. chipmunk genotype I]|uniref:signal peptide containing large with proline stretches n=1 Tax=Cryptosporidium sp. chipmunk genotype I TaxID=1280935 RepID=UPI003519DBC9|nr:signal peptide containing large with proline stretches [Cryptosporidium sp. chipmunk genotype I]
MRIIIILFVLLFTQSNFQVNDLNIFQESFIRLKLLSNINDNASEGGNGEQIPEELQGAAGGYCEECEKEGNKRLCTHSNGNEKDFSTFIPASYSDIDEEISEINQQFSDLELSTDQDKQDEESDPFRGLSLSKTIQKITKTDIEGFGTEVEVLLKDLVKVHKAIRKNFVTEENVLSLFELCNQLKDAIIFLSSAVDEIVRQHRRNKDTLFKMIQKNRNCTTYRVFNLRNENKQLILKASIIKIRLRNLKMAFSKYCMPERERILFLMRQSIVGRFMSTRLYREKIRRIYNLKFLPYIQGNHVCPFDHTSNRCTKKNPCKQCKEFNSQFISGEFEKELKKVNSIERQFNKISRVRGQDYYTQLDEYSSLERELRELESNEVSSENPPHESNLEDRSDNNLSKLPSKPKKSKSPLISVTKLNNMINKKHRSRILQKQMKREEKKRDFNKKSKWDLKSNLTKFKSELKKEKDKGKNKIMISSPVISSNPQDCSQKDVNNQDPSNIPYNTQGAQNTASNNMDATSSDINITNIDRTIKSEKGSKLKSQTQYTSAKSAVRIGNVEPVKNKKSKEFQISSLKLDPITRILHDKIVAQRSKRNKKNKIIINSDGEKDSNSSNIACERKDSETSSCAIQRPFTDSDFEDFSDSFSEDEFDTYSESSLNGQATSSINESLIVNKHSKSENNHDSMNQTNISGPENRMHETLDSVVTSFRFENEESSSKLPGSDTTQLVIQENSIQNTRIEQPPEQSDSHTEVTGHFAPLYTPEGSLQLHPSPKQQHIPRIITGIARRPHLKQSNKKVRFNSQLDKEHLFDNIEERDDSLISKQSKLSESTSIGKPQTGILKKVLAKTQCGHLNKNCKILFKSAHGDERKHTNIQKHQRTASRGPLTQNKLKRLLKKYQTQKSKNLAGENVLLRNDEQRCPSPTIPKTIPKPPPFPAPPPPIPFTDRSPSPIPSQQENFHESPLSEASSESNTTAEEDNEGSSSDPAVDNVISQGNSQLNKPKTNRKPITKREMKKLLERRRVQTNKNLTGGNSKTLDAEGHGSEQSDFSPIIPSPPPFPAPPPPIPFPIKSPSSVSPQGENLDESLLSGTSSESNTTTEEDNEDSTPEPVVDNLSRQGVSQLSKPKTNRKPITKREMKKLLERRRVQTNKNLTGGNSKTLDAEGHGSEQSDFSPIIPSPPPFPAPPPPIPFPIKSPSSVSPQGENLDESLLSGTSSESNTTTEEDNEDSTPEPVVDNLSRQGVSQLSKPKTNRKPITKKAIQGLLEKYRTQTNKSLNKRNSRTLDDERRFPSPSIPETIPRPPPFPAPPPPISFPSSSVFPIPSQQEKSRESPLSGTSSEPNTASEEDNEDSTPEPVVDNMSSQGVSQLSKPKTNRKPITKKAIQGLLEKYRTRTNKNFTGGNFRTLDIEQKTLSNNISQPIQSPPPFLAPPPFSIPFPIRSSSPSLIQQEKLDESPLSGASSESNTTAEGDNEGSSSEPVMDSVSNQGYSQLNKPKTNRKPITKKAIQGLLEKYRTQTNKSLNKRNSRTLDDERRFPSPSIPETIPRPLPFPAPPPPIPFPIKSPFPIPSQHENFHESPLSGTSSEPNTTAEEDNEDSTPEPTVDNVSNQGYSQLNKPKTNRKPITKKAIQRLLEKHRTQTNKSLTVENSRTLDIEQRDTSPTIPRPPPFPLPVPSTPSIPYPNRSQSHIQTQHKGIGKDFKYKISNMREVINEEQKKTSSQLNSNKTRKKRRELRSKWKPSTILKLKRYFKKRENELERRKDDDEEDEKEDEEESDYENVNDPFNQRPPSPPQPPTLSHPSAPQSHTPKSFYSSNSYRKEGSNKNLNSETLINSGIYAKKKKMNFNLANTRTYHQEMFPRLEKTIIKRKFTKKAESSNRQNSASMDADEVSTLRNLNKFEEGNKEGTIRQIFPKALSSHSKFRIKKKGSSKNKITHNARHFLTKRLNLKSLKSQKKTKNHTKNNKHPSNTTTSSNYNSSSNSMNGILLTRRSSNRNKPANGKTIARARTSIRKRLRKPEGFSGVPTNRHFTDNSSASSSEVDLVDNPSRRASTINRNGSKKLKKTRKSNKRN